jgi:hypothetical protein
MRYQNDLLAQQYDDLHQKYMEACCSSDVNSIESAENALAFFEEFHFRKPMVFEEEELSMLMPIMKDNYKNLSKPAYFRFENGKLRKPVIYNGEEKEIVEHILTPRMGGFTGRVFVNNWSSVDDNNLADNKVSVSAERSLIG